MSNVTDEELMEKMLETQIPEAPEEEIVEEAKENKPVEETPKAEVNKEDPFNLNGDTATNNVDNSNSTVDKEKDINNAIDTLDELTDSATPKAPDTSVLDNQIERASAPVNDSNIVTDLQNNVINNIASAPIPEAPQVSVTPQVEEVKPVLENLPKPEINGFMQSPPKDAVV
jgi:hypothetical protein